MQLSSPRCAFLNRRVSTHTSEQAVVGDVSDVEKLKADMPLLQAKMKPRHLTMIAVGGSIGTGLFVASGSALHNGGPAGVLIAWILIGIMMINVTQVSRQLSDYLSSPNIFIQALGEMAILFPVSGGFYTLAGRFLDPAFAFAMGYNYVFQWAATLPFEITVAVTTVNYWTDKVPAAVWITIFWVVIIIACIFGTLGFAEEEFWSSCLKLFVVVMFVFIGV